MNTPRPDEAVSRPTRMLATVRDPRSAMVRGRAAVVRLSDTGVAVAVTGSKLVAGVDFSPPRIYGLSFAAAEFQGLQAVGSPGSCSSLPLSGSGAPSDAAADADGRGTASMGRRGAGARGLDGGIRPAQQVYGRRRGGADARGSG